MRLPPAIALALGAEALDLVTYTRATEMNPLVAALPFEQAVAAKVALGVLLVAGWAMIPFLPYVGQVLWTMVIRLAVIAGIVGTLSNVL